MKFIRALILLIGLPVLASGALLAWIKYEVHTPMYNQTEQQPFSVARGESLDSILNSLQSRGIIHSALALRIYLRLKKQVPAVQAGNYIFSSPSTPLQVLQKLKEGGRFDRLTIIEGWTLFDVADQLQRTAALHLASAQDAMNLLVDTALIRDLDPKATNLEGYLFPDTYFLLSEQTPKELVAEMINHFRKVWRTKLADKAQQRNMSVHDVVTIASIIETEAKLKEERPIIASVIENRIKRSMPLSMDSTVVYASKLAGKWKYNGKVYQSDIDRDSPYNTRRYAGLPPGPVGCPGLSSLEAAVTPARTDYLYYVRNPDRNDGAHNFYASEKAFEKGVQALRAWEKRRK